MSDMSGVLDDVEARLPWPVDWETRRDPADAIACQRLWQAVLIACIRAAVEDALEPNRKLCRVDRQIGRVRSGWIGSRDFHAICSLAGLDGVVVRRAVDGAEKAPGGLQAFVKQLASCQRHPVLGGPDVAGIPEGIRDVRGAQA